MYSDLKVVGNEKRGVGRLANIRRWLRTVAIDACLFFNFVVLFFFNMFSIPFSKSYTVKKAVKLLDVPSRNTSLMLKKNNGNVEFLCLSTYVLFFPLCHRMKKFDIRAVKKISVHA
jgi:hypothetical protein